MKLGVHIGYWGLGLTAQDQLDDRARRPRSSATTRSGPRRPTARTRRRSSPGSPARPRRSSLGSAIFQMPGRSAAMTAMTAATLDQLSDGRFILGIGSSGPQVSEGWHGVRFGKQLPAHARVRRRSLRMALARERVEYHGETIDLPLPDGPGKALKLTIAPVQEQIPIYIAAIGPEEHAAGRRDRRRRHPDVLLPRARPVSCATSSRPAWTARATARRSTTSRWRRTVQVFVADDMREARDLMRPFIGLYIGGMGSREQELLQPARRSATASRTPPRRSRTSTSTARRTRPRAAIPDELIDTVAICGPKEHVRERLAAYRDAGVGTLGVIADGLRQGRAPRAAAPGRRAALSAAACEGPPRRLRRSRARVPGDRAGRRAARARARGRAGDLGALARGRRGRGAGVRRRAGVRRLPHPGAAAEAVRGGRPRDATDTRALVARVRAGRRRGGHPDARARARRRAGGRALGDARPPRRPAARAGLPALLASARGCRAPRSAARLWGALDARSWRGPRARARGAQRDARGASGCRRSAHVHGGISRELVPGRRPSRSSSTRARGEPPRAPHAVGPLQWEPPTRATSGCREGDAAARARRARRPRRTRRTSCCARRSPGWPDAPVRVLATLEPAARRSPPSRSGRTPGSSSGSPTRGRCRAATSSSATPATGRCVRALTSRLRRGRRARRPGDMNENAARVDWARRRRADPAAARRPRAPSASRSTARSGSRRCAARARELAGLGRRRTPRARAPRSSSRPTSPPGPAEERATARAASRRLGVQLRGWDSNPQPFD